MVRYFSRTFIIITMIIEYTWNGGGCMGKKNFNNQENVILDN